MSGFHNLAARGLSVFPITRSSKSPAIEWSPFRYDRASVEQLNDWAISDYNTGVATGSISNCFVLDLDNADALIDALERNIPRTFTVKTPRGWHYYFQHPGFQVRNRVGPKWTGGILGWDIRGDGGYVVGPGSFYEPNADELKKGKVEGYYSIEADVPILPAPEWLLAMMRSKVAEDTPVVPLRVAETSSPYGRKAMRAELKILEDAQPGTINAQINSSVFSVAQLVAGGEITEADARGAIEEALVGLGVADEEKAQGTVERAWIAGFGHPRAAPPAPSATDVYGTRETLAPGEAPPPPNHLAPTMPLTQAQTEDKTSHLALQYWLNATQRSIRKNEFTGTIEIDGRPIDDDTSREIWLKIREASWVKFAFDLFNHTLENVAYQNRYHPLREYLDSVQQRWDGTPRIDRWLTDYLGVPFDPFSECVGALFLTALVRRVRQPGAKFDEMLVLEGPQGVEKSSALQALCPDETWFTDEVAVGMDSKQLLEVTSGKWIVEAPELKGLVGRGVDHIKAFLSRRHDKARLSYGRHAVERGREWVVASTTNDERYLDDPTGNRRLWPVVVGAVRLAAIRAERDQLWAEACVREATGASIRMPQHLWQTAADVQSERMMYDSMRDAIDDVLKDMTGRVKGKHVLDAIKVPVDRQASVARKFGETMRALGWENKLVKIDGKPMRFFVRGDPARSIIMNAYVLQYQDVELHAV